MMHKKAGFMLALVAFAAGSAFAQEAAKPKLALGLDLAPLFRGFVYANSEKTSGTKTSQFALAPAIEYVVAPHWTIGAGLDLWIGEVGEISNLYFALVAHGRYYPSSVNLSGFFLDAGLGINRFAIDGETKGGFGFFGLTSSLKASYKAMVKNKMFFEPAMSYVYSKSPVYGVPTPSGWQAGLMFGAAF